MRLREEKKRVESRKKKNEELAARGGQQIAQMKPSDFTFLNVLGRGSFGKVNSLSFYAAIKFRYFVVLA